MAIIVIVSVVYCNRRRAHTDRIIFLADPKPPNP